MPDARPRKIRILPGPVRRRSLPQGAFLWALALPAVLYVFLMVVYPLGSALYLSLFDYNLTDVGQPKSFVGLQNYADLFRAPLGRQAVWNTVLFTVPAVTIELVFGMAVALLLWRDDRFNSLATSLMLVPVAFTPLVAGLLFRVLYNVDYGPIGYYARQLGINGGQSLTGTPQSAMPALIIIDVWQWTPLVMLILLAGLKSLPRDVMEAAAIDGATGWHRFLYVMLPLLLPTIFLALVIRTMDALKLFDSVYAITQGGPNNATMVLNFHAYKEGLEFFNVGYATAVSNTLLLLISLFAVLYLVTIRRADARMQKA